MYVTVRRVLLIENDFREISSEKSRKNHHHSNHKNEKSSNFHPLRGCKCFSLKKLRKVLISKR